MGRHASGGSARRLLSRLTWWRKSLDRALGFRASGIARRWSNRQLRKLCPPFGGDVVNVSAWRDSDKEGGVYRDYFPNASGYYYTNFSGTHGLQGFENEYFLDLSEALPEELHQRFDVAYNHTTLEHIFDVANAFANLCALSRDVVILVVPFAQAQHEKSSYEDYWRFTPTCLRRLFRSNGLEVLYEAQNRHKNAAIYLLFVASRHPDRWRGRMPPFEPIAVAGDRIGYGLGWRLYLRLRRLALGRTEDAAPPREEPK